MSLTDYVIMPGSDYLAMCNSVRAKTGGTEVLKSGDIASAISGITGKESASDFVSEATLTDYVIMPSSDYQAICDSIRAKTGKTELLKSGDIASAIDNIVVQVSSDLFPLQEITTTYSSDDDAYVCTLEQCNLVLGETYIVEWDGVSYTCLCQKHNIMFSTVGITSNESVGNIYQFKKYYGYDIIFSSSNINTGEPFIITKYGSSEKATVRTEETDSTHTLRIYQ